MGTRVEPGGEVDDQVGAGPHFLFDEVIEEVGARDKRPLVLFGEWLRPRDLLAAAAGEPPCIRVAKDRVLALGLARAINGDPACGVRDVANQGGGHRVRQERVGSM